MRRRSYAIAVLVSAVIAASILSRTETAYAQRSGGQTTSTSTAPGASTRWQYASLSELMIFDSKLIGTTVVRTDPKLSITFVQPTGVISGDGWTAFLDKLSGTAGGHEKAARIEALNLIGSLGWEFAWRQQDNTEVSEMTTYYFKRQVR